MLVGNASRMQRVSGVGWRAALLAVTLAIAGCGKSVPPPSEADLALAALKDSFAKQLAANQFIQDYQANGDELTFTGPGADGGVAKWRVHIDSAVIEPNVDASQPLKGVVKSSWYSDNRPVVVRGNNSNLPLELTDNGLAQECWAFWDKVAKRWSWE